MKKTQAHTAHPDEEGRVENVLYRPRKRLGVNDEFEVWNRRVCWDGNRDKQNYKKKTIIMRFDIQGGCDFKHTIILVITLQVAEDPLHLPLGGFLMGVIHFLQLTT